MNNTTWLRAALPLGCLASSLHAADTAPATLEDALRAGKVSLNVRARYEHVDQTNLKDADAFTLRTRLGYTTGAFHGFKASAEFENIATPDGDSYSQAGINPGGAGRAVVADPEVTEVNQAWLSYTAYDTTLTAGRQRLVFDNARFVGDVAWRQNMQTFDAVLLQSKAVKDLTASYAYVDRVNRVFSHRHPQGDWESSSHLFNASYAGLKPGTLTAYSYLLDFDKATANSCATYGASFAGATPLNDTLKATYRVEAAVQTDYASSTLDYTATYTALEAGVAHKLGSLSLGYELLSGDNNVGFKTPLATLHAFNGWADLFLTTPGAGLRDIYLKGTANLPFEVALTAFYHRFEDEDGDIDYGDEIDLQLSRKIIKNLTGTVKYAYFANASSTYPNVQKIWAQLDYVY